MLHGGLKVEEVERALLEERVGAQSPGEGEQESEHICSLAGSRVKGWRRSKAWCNCWDLEAETGEKAFWGKVKGGEQEMEGLLQVQNIFRVGE